MVAILFVIVGFFIGGLSVRIENQVYAHDAVNAANFCLSRNATLDKLWVIYDCPTPENGGCKHFTCISKNETRYVEVLGWTEHSIAETVK